MEKLRRILGFPAKDAVFGSGLENTSRGQIIPPFIVASLSSFEKFYKSKGPFFIEDHSTFEVDRNRVASIISQINNGYDILWDKATEDDPWLAWEITNAFLDSLSAPLIPNSALEKIFQLDSVTHKHTSLLLHRHVVESIPRGNCALLEYLTSQIQHFADAFKLPNEMTRPLFLSTCNAAYRSKDEKAWTSFSLLVDSHDKVFRAKFHPLSNSLTVPPAISLCQVAAATNDDPSARSSATDQQNSNKETPQKRDIAILALDGGGMRGLIEIKILSELATRIYGDCEENGTRKLLANFDIVAGTSTGGIIALALQKMPLSKVREFYLSMGKEIFKSSYLYGIGRWFRYYQTGDYYSAETLTSLFKTEFGNTNLSDIFPDANNKQRLFLAATNATNAVWEPFVLRSYRNPTCIIPGTETVTTPNALRATSAAPTYFSAVELKVRLQYQGSVPGVAEHAEVKVQLVDGGMTANNPTELAIFEAHHLSEAPIGLIVSIGTGMPGKQPGSVNVFKMLNELIDICTSSNAIHTRVLEWIEIMPDPKPLYFRFNPANGEGSYSLDESDDAALAALEASTEKYMNAPAVLQMIRELERAFIKRGK